MIYQIYYIPKGSKEDRRYVMFEIEYYISKYDINKMNNWISKLHCLSCVEGVTKFLKDKLNDKDFDCDEFIKLGKEIEGLRGLLYEQHENKPRVYSVAKDFHYKVFGKVLEEKIEAFANKYDLHINRD